MFLGIVVGFILGVNFGVLLFALISVGDKNK